VLGQCGATFLQSLDSYLQCPHFPNGASLCDLDPSLPLIAQN